MNKRTFKRVAAMGLCLAMVSGWLPGVQAAVEKPDDGRLEVAFFTGESADDAVSDYTVTYSDETMKKGESGAGYDKGAAYLETESAAVGSTVTFSELEGIPEDTYQVDLIYKQNKSGRASVQCALDDTWFDPVIDLGSTAGPAQQVDGSTLLNGNATTASTFYTYRLADSLEVTGESHTFTAKTVTEGKIVLYGLLLTSLSAPPVELDTETLEFDLLAGNEAAIVSAVVSDAYDTLVWSVEDDQVAAVEDLGDGTASVTPVGVGQTVVTATVQSKEEPDVQKSAEVTVTVTESPAITLDYSKLSLNLAQAETGQVQATVDERFEQLSWRCEDEKVATVEDQGDGMAVVTPVGVGETVLYASVTRKDDPEQTKTAQVQVRVYDEAEIAITYQDDAQTVRTVDTVEKSVTVEADAVVESLLSELRAPDGGALTFQVKTEQGEEKTEGALYSSDQLVVTDAGGASAVYRLVVLGDTTSTDIAAAKPEDFEFGMQGSNIGAITDDSITLVDGKVRRLWVMDAVDGTSLNKSKAKEINKSDYTGEVGRLQALRSADEIVTQLESVNGTNQSYQIVSATGEEKHDELPVTGDKLMVTAEDGQHIHEYAITVVTAAVSGKLELLSDTVTAGTSNTLVLEYYAGQRTPEAQVEIDLPVAVREEDITVNVIGRGDVPFADFSKSRGELRADGTFENEDMHAVLGRFAEDYDYQTLGEAELINGGRTIRFTGVDLRPNNGADLRITLKNVSFEEKGSYHFSARLTTADSSVDSTLSGLSSLGQGPETAVLEVRDAVSDLQRLPYDPALAEPNYTYDEEKGGVTGLSYLDYSEMGELYSNAYLSWTPADGVDTVDLYVAKGTVEPGGTVVSGEWTMLATIPNSGSYTVTGLEDEAYYQFKLVADGGAHSGESNTVAHYSGRLDATLFGLTADGDATANKQALNRAIDWLNEIGGGTVYIPGNGDNDAPLTYPIGTIYLQSNVYLYIARGAMLQATSGKMDGPESAWWHYGDYGSGTNSSEDPYANPDNFLSKQDDGHCFFQNCMIYARRADNIKIIGTGRLDGNGVLNTGDGTVHKQATNKTDNMISFKLCTNVEVGGMNTYDDLMYDLEKAQEYTRKDARPMYRKAGDDLSNMLYIDRGGHFVMLSTGSDNVNIHDVYYQHYNTGNARDVWDFMGNRNVYATNIFAASTSDDIIKLGSDCALGFTRPVWNYKVRNIVGDTNCNNFQLGSETADDTRDVYVDNLVVMGANKAGFSISTNDGALVQNINLNTGETGPVFTEESGYFQRTKTPIFISISHRGRVLGAENYVTPDGERAVRNVAMGHVDNVNFNHVRIVDAYGGSTYNKDSGFAPYDPSSHQEYTSVVVGYRMPEGVTDADMPDGRATGYVTNVTFKDVTLTVKGYNQNGNYTFADTERTCNELNVGQYNSPDMGIRPSYGFYVRHAQNVTFEDVTLDFEGTQGGTDDRYPIVFDDVDGAVLNHVTMSKGLGVNGLVQLRDASGITLTNCSYVDKGRGGETVAVADADGLSSASEAQEDWTVYPALKAYYSIMLESVSATVATEVDNGTGTITCLEDNRVEQLLGDLQSSNALTLELTVVDASGKEKDAEALVATGDRLIASCDSDAALSSQKEYAITVVEPDRNTYVEYCTDGTVNATLRSEPDGLIATSDDGGVAYLQQKNSKVGNAFLIDLPVQESGNYAVALIIKKGTRATVQNYIDDLPVGEPVDLGDATGLEDAGPEIGSSKSSTYYIKPLTDEIELTQGTHTFRSVVTEDGDTVIQSVRLTRLDSDEPEEKYYPITVEVQGEGTAFADQTEAAEGTPITLTAQPAVGWHFVGWTSTDIAIKDNYFTMPAQAVTVTAVFEQDELTAVTGVKLNAESVYLYSNFGPRGEQLIATVEPADADDKSVTWTSADENVVTVNDVGYLTVVGEGMTTVTVTTNDGGYTAQCLVQVGSYNDGSDAEDEDTTPPTETEEPGETTDPGETTEPETRIFSDVPATHWASKAVDYVVSEGLFNGTSDTTFSPEMPMTRAMFFTVLARLDGVDTTGGATWYEKAMAWAVAEGITDGTNPEATITREQLAVMLYRYAGSPAAEGSLTGFADAALPRR